STRDFFIFVSSFKECYFYKILEFDLFALQCQHSCDRVSTMRATLLKQTFSAGFITPIIVQ
ncbi:MAG: hypothetical protein RR910_08695, partial [Acidaminococcaceae bacterium]